MNNDTFESILARHKYKIKRDVVLSEDDVSLPVKGGRQTIPEGTSGTIGGFLNELATINPDFNVRLLDALETLGTYHADVSYAVDNIKQLGNTTYKVYFDDDTPKELQKEMMMRIKTKSKTQHSLYAYSGGINSLVNDAFGQIAITGALSAEIVPDDNLTGVKKVVIVAPSSIRFVYDDDKDEYIPYQIIRNGLSLDGKDRVQLNTITYKYIAMGRFGEKPYAKPPFLSALENVAIGRDMQDNLRYVVKKLGTLGFLEVLVNGPKPKPNEEADDYYKRTQSYLNKIIPEIDKGLSKGYVAGFKDVHEFNMHNTTSNVAGSKDLVELNDTKTMAGLKQDPLMFGRNFSTTETLGRVILAKMTTQVSNYQKIVASFLESIFLMDLQLAGYPIKNLEVVFDPPMVGDKGREADAYGKELSNLDTLLQRGIIDIYQYATEAGYEKPADAEKHKINPFLPKDGEEDPESPDETKGGKKTDPNEEKEATEENIRALYDSLGGSLPQYDYDTLCTCCEHGDHSHSFDKKSGDPLDEFIHLYYSATKTNYDRAVKKATVTIAQKLLELGEGATESQIKDVLLFNLYKDWAVNFTAKQLKTIEKFVEAAYSFFRKDKSVFGDAAESIPNGVFSLTDLRAIEYYKKSDQLYLGKFITDDDLNKRITTFIKEKHLAGELPIGNNKKALKAFKEEFGDLMQGQDFKIVRILDTTVNKMRNTAAVNYMKQADVSEYEIVGVKDRLQCEYCKNVQGVKFSVDTASNHIDSFTRSQPLYVGADSPFITSVFKKPEDMKNLSGSDLQARGVHFPPFHCHCRDQVVAVL